ncbi:MAG: glycoside hydrolase family 3 C-terminal domain-containing protein [Spirochaetales bacterium]|nr:glycoside hydrolase family 3 C-terminal domain-containing protein [Spirochaetales bacterium]
MSALKTGLGTIRAASFLPAALILAACGGACSSAASRAGSATGVELSMEAEDLSGADDMLPAPLANGAIPADAVCRNPAATPGERARDLLSRMTLEEKVGQMTQAARDYLLGAEEDIARYGLGSLLSGGGSGPRANTAEAWADMYDRYQRAALSSRLGIPMIYGIDAVHGNNNVRGSTIFPHNIGMGAAGDPELVREAARVTAVEVAATGVDWTFAPCVAPVRDIRWGRTYEGYSEDPALAGILGEAATRGFQEGRPEDSILACAKHFLGDGGTGGGRDRGDTRVDEATLRSLFLSPYLPSLEAGVGSVMVSFSSWNGQPMHQNRYLITEVLKGELGFKGIVVSDWAGVREAPGDPVTQVRLAINAGIDMVMVPDDYKGFIETLLGLVRSGEVSMARVDDAVLRILETKFRIGLFERPWAERSLLSAVGSPAHRAVARKAVRASQVLLKDEGLLPLPKTGRILLAGSAADNVGLQCGGWTLTWQGVSGNAIPGTSLVEALREVGGPGVEVIVVEDPESIAGMRKEGDVAVVASGERPYAEGMGDDGVLLFRPADLEYLRAFESAGVPALTVLFSGRPLMIGEALGLSRAFVAGFLPGTEAGGLADLLFGEFPFTGRLPYTWPDSVDAIPIQSAMTGPGVLFPRGWGLGG